MTLLVHIVMTGCMKGNFVIICYTNFYNRNAQHAIIPPKSVVLKMLSYPKENSSIYKKKTRVDNFIQNPATNNGMTIPGDNFKCHSSPLNSTNVKILRLWPTILIFFPWLRALGSDERFKVVAFPLIGSVETGSPSTVQRWKPPCCFICGPHVKWPY